jgi:hypothetical protein
VAATLNAQLHAARVELEAERTESVQLKRQVEATTSELAKRVDALQTVRRAVTFEESSGRTLQPLRVLTRSASALSKPAATPVGLPLVEEVQRR